tara:strand:+ start:410 stop:700 length:291 start_codon:yes stop_codon:yes gene_type:complete
MKSLTQIESQLTTKSRLEVQDLCVQISLLIQSFEIKHVGKASNGLHLATNRDIKHMDWLQLETYLTNNISEELLNKMVKFKTEKLLKAMDFEKHLI